MVIKIILITALVLFPWLPNCGGRGSDNPLDTTPPSIPANLSVMTISPSEIILSWSPSKDNVQVSKYRVYRSGLFLKEVKTTNTSDISNSSPHKFCYSVSAVDSSGNESAQNQQVCISDPILKPYKYLGAFVPGWHWQQWSEAIDDDLIQSAKKNGITVFHLMLPYFEYPLSTYRESELRKLDHFLNIASKNNTYAMISFIHAYGITLSMNDPYYHPAGIEGLMYEEKLKKAFKNRIKHIINRRNSVNGKLYKEDPTILAWIVCDEPISAPFNYPVRPPNITVGQFKSWLEEMTSYIKDLDQNHPVTIFIQPAFSTLREGDWLESLNLPSLDFIYGEDADMRILNYFPHLTANEYSLRLFELGKPAVVMLSFTSGEWDQSSMCRDYNFQADLLEKAINRYFEIGSKGVTIFSWGSKFYSFIPLYDECFNYNEENTPICTVLKKIGHTLNQ